MNRGRTKPATIRRLLLSAAIGATAVVGAAAASAPAHASGCPDPDNPCDPTPIDVLPKLGKPSVTFGCGTVTVTSGDVSKTVRILPCPGPVV